MCRIALLYAIPNRAGEISRESSAPMYVATMRLENHFEAHISKEEKLQPLPAACDPAHSSCSQRLLSLPQNRAGK